MTSVVGVLPYPGVVKLKAQCLDEQYVYVHLYLCTHNWVQQYVTLWCNTPNRCALPACWHAHIELDMYNVIVLHGYAVTRVIVSRAEHGS